MVMFRIGKKKAENVELEAAKKVLEELEATRKTVELDAAKKVLDRETAIQTQRELYLANKVIKTQCGYRRALTRWGNILGKTPWAEAREEHAMALAKSLDTGKVSKICIAMQLRVVSRFYTRLLLKGLITSNPFVEVVDTYRGTKYGNVRPTKLFPFDRVDEFCNAPGTGTAEGLRDSAFFALLFGGALRIGEAAKLRIGQVKRDELGYLVARLLDTKNGDDASQRIMESHAATIEALVTARKQETNDDPNAPLFRSYHMKTGEALRIKQLSRIWEKWVVALKIPGTPTPHSARATSITRILDRLKSRGETDYRRVRAFSRHSSIQMVEHYDKKRNDGTKEMVDLLDFSSEVQQ